MSWNTKVIESSDQNVLKYVFTKDDAVAEAVLYKYPTYQERTVICCSTMSGCPIGCRFCGAGDHFVRVLTTEEIMEQVEVLLEDKDILPAECKRIQIMFMSMGEPMLNMNSLGPALVHMWNQWPNAALLISTSAPRADRAFEDLFSYARVIPTIGLQFSIHESTDLERDALIPFKAKYTLKEIAKLGERFYEVCGRTPFFNYCAHPNNVDDKNVSDLLALFNPKIWQATISVICERDESVAAANQRQKQLAQDFMSKLGGVGYSTRCFDPAGQDDIGGGCGQLWFVQDWMKSNPDKAKQTCGHGLPSVHTPRPELVNLIK